jgi:hypothetical protein
MLKVKLFETQNGVAVLITAASGINGKVTLKRSSAKDSDITKATIMLPAGNN